MEALRCSTKICLTKFESCPSISKLVRQVFFPEKLPICSLGVYSVDKQVHCVYLQAEAGEETTSSQGEWEDYNDTLTEVLTWLEQAEKNLKAQAQISNDVDEVKDQFHEHEVSYVNTIKIGFWIILRITIRIVVLIKVSIMTKKSKLKFQLIY